MLLEQALDCEPGLQLDRLLSSNCRLGVKPSKTLSQCGNSPFLMTRGAGDKPCQHHPLHRWWAQPCVLLFTPCKAVTLGTGYPTATEVSPSGLYLCTWRSKPSRLRNTAADITQLHCQTFADRMTVLYGYKNSYKRSCLKSNKIYDVCF